MAMTSTSAPSRAEALSVPAAVVRMGLGAMLLSTTSIFVVLAQVAPTVSAFYRMLFGGVILLG